MNTTSTPSVAHNIGTSHCSKSLSRSLTRTHAHIHEGHKTSSDRKTIDYTKSSIEFVHHRATYNRRMKQHLRSVHGLTCRIVNSRSWREIQTTAYFFLNIFNCECCFHQARSKGCTSTMWQLKSVCMYIAICYLYCNMECVNRCPAHTYKVMLKNGPEPNHLDLLVTSPRGTQKATSPLLLLARADVFRLPLATCASYIKLLHKLAV